MTLRQILSAATENIRMFSRPDFFRSMYVKAKATTGGRTSIGVTASNHIIHFEAGDVVFEYARVTVLVIDDRAASIALSRLTSPPHVGHVRAFCGSLVLQLGHFANID
jgi:hypothetical protein